uniref:Methyltransferase n=1 Tax=Rhipicephalus zambeziensis TaxID=60191 RepID=A0A224YTC9_9ACAR
MAIRQLEQQGFRWVRYPRRRGLDWFLERVQHLEPHEFLKDFHLRDWLVFGTGAKLNTLDLVKNLQVLLQDKDNLGCRQERQTPRSSATPGEKWWLQVHLQCAQH